MKVDDSGMPAEDYWNSLFDIPGIVDWLAIQPQESIVEVGCGYGTFTVPVAQRTQATVYTYDIEPAMVETTRQRAAAAGLRNVEAHCRDLIEQGTGLPTGSVHLVLLFNILHFAERRQLLQEAARNLVPGGRVAIIHWRRDIATPRGPAVELRPDLDMILRALEGTSLAYHGVSQTLPPYHLGIQLHKGESV